MPSGEAPRIFKEELKKDVLATTPFAENCHATHDGLTVRCPLCHNPIIVEESSTLADVLCPLCGSNFSLAGDVSSTMSASDLCEIGHFRLIDRLGMGTFGIVWKAHDTKLDRIVAIKIPRQRRFDDQQERAFLREAQNVAQLNHPYIVPVHEVGRSNNTLYIVTDYIQGVTLAEWLTAREPSISEAIAFCTKIARILQHAHQRGVVHRDLKPGNIMIDAEGEPHLMDFGLARRDAGDVSMTLDGQILGTPAFMSPEQARGEGHNADPCSDLYSLGVIMFRLLTGELPFRGNIRMLIHQMINEDAPSPRKLNAQIPLDLETICLKCLEKEPQKRYSSAAFVADELERFQRGESIVARPIGQLERIWRWYTKNPTVSVLAAGGYIAALMMIMTLWGLFGILFYATGLHPTEKPYFAIAEILCFSSCIYLPGLVAGIGVLKGRFGFVWLGLLVLTLGLITLVTSAVGIGPELENFRAAENSLFIRYQLLTLLGTMTALGLALHAFALFNGWALLRKGDTSA